MNPAELRKFRHWNLAKQFKPVIQNIFKEQNKENIKIKIRMSISSKNYKNEFKH